jgi:hypothetical protein
VCNNTVEQFEVEFTRTSQGFGTSKLDRSHPMPLLRSLHNRVDGECLWSLGLASAERFITALCAVRTEFGYTGADIVCILRQSMNSKWPMGPIQF